MTMIILIKLWEFIKTRVIAIPLSLEEGVCVMDDCDTCFYLWLRINELVALKMKYLRRDVSVKPSVN